MINVHLKNDNHDEVKELLKTSPNYEKDFKVLTCECSSFNSDERECNFLIYCYECEDKLEEKENEKDSVYFLDLDELRTNPRESVFSLLSAFPAFWLLDYKIFIT